ncbi:MAG: hypothetical protein K2Z81_22825, partial [Cyanobacteria bacterium]|nr:hypothetical protein [Cyanobacteriota bacterium]
MEGEDREPERRPAQDELGDTGTADKQPDPFQQEAQQLLDRMSASTAESKSTLPTLSSGNEVLLFTDPFAKRGAKSAELPVFALAGAGGEGERAEVGSRRDQQQQERGIRRPAFES